MSTTTTIADYPAPGLRPPIVAPPKTGNADSSAKGSNVEKKAEQFQDHAHKASLDPLSLIIVILGFIVGTGGLLVAYASIIH